MANRTWAVKATVSMDVQAHDEMTASTKAIQLVHTLRGGVLVDGVVVQQIEITAPAPRLTKSLSSSVFDT